MTTQRVRLRPTQRSREELDALKNQREGNKILRAAFNDAIMANTPSRFVFIGESIMVDGIKMVCLPQSASTEPNKCCSDCALNDPMYLNKCMMYQCSRHDRADNKYVLFKKEKDDSVEF